MIAENNDSMFGDEGGYFEQGAAPQNVEHTPYKNRTEFFPWHKPRKHYLRENQWSASIANLVDQLDLKTKERSLHYLSLPGPDLLDVRTLEPMCQLKQIKLSFLGLNDGESNGDHEPLNSALFSQVLALPAIDSLSSVIPDKFEHLSKKDSIAYERVIASHRSFDVINVDLCGTLAEAPPGQPGPTLINAAFNLILHQAKSRTEDWLLFLTTRSNKDKVDQDVMQKMIDWQNELIRNDATLLPIYIANGFVSEDELTLGEIDIHKLSPDAHSTLFTVGLSHWIFNVLLSNEPAWRVNMLPHFGYHVLLRDKTCDMISMGFYCKPLLVNQPKDAMGIAHVPIVRNIADIAETKKTGIERINRRIRDIQDVDIMLHNDPDLYEVSLNKSAELLRSALYDEVKYREFAEEQRKLIEVFLKKNKLVPS